MALIPETKDLRIVNPFLTDYVSALVQGRDQYVTPKLFDATPTERTGAVWLKNTLDGMGDADLDLERDPGTEFRRDEGNAPSYTDFTLRSYGRERTLADEIADDSQLPYDLAMDFVEDLLDIGLIARDYRSANFFFDNTRYPTVNVGATSDRWDTPAGNAFYDLDRMFERAELASQNGPINTLVLGRPAGYALARCKKFLDSLSTTRDRVGQVEWPLIVEKLASHYGLNPERIIWAKVLRNTAARGAAQSNGAIFGDFVWAGNLSESQARSVRGGIRVKGVAAVVARKKPSGILPTPANAEAPDFYVSVYREEGSKKTVLRVETDEVIVPLRNSAGQLLEDVAA